MPGLTREQQQAVDASAVTPARVVNPTTRDVEVLLRANDFEWIRQLLGDEADAPRRLDPRTGISYAVLTEGRYERFKAFFEEDPLTAAERAALIREAGKRAGWNNAAWDCSQERT
jgi:hypothetical protein